MAEILNEKRKKLLPLLIFTLAYLLILSYFKPFLNNYGDVQAYVASDRFNILNYQPIWPYIAGNLFKHFGIAGLFYFQSTLYFLSAIFLYMTTLPISKKASVLLLGFMAINIRSYFYIANPLTEIFNFFLFSLSLFLFLQIDRRKSTAILFLSAFVFLLIGFSRSANLIFLLILSLLVTLRALQGAPKINIFIVVPALLASLIFNFYIQDKPNNTGINLLRFIYLACDSSTKDIKPCSGKIFDSEKTPITRNYFHENGKIARVEKSFEQKGMNVWDPEFSREMKAIYPRLLIFSPGRFFDAALINYEQHLSDTYVLPYPEDINKEILTFPVFKFMDHFSTSWSLFFGLTAPLLIVLYLVFFLRKKHLQTHTIFLISWISFEVMTSILLFANLWISDASRMRFHYEIPALLLAFITAKNESIR